MDPIHMNKVTGTILQTAWDLHQELGWGMYESVYKGFILDELVQRGYQLQTEVPIPIHFRGRTVNRGFRADIVVENSLIVEVKSVESLRPEHWKQLHTYLKLSGLPLGLLINFGAPLFKGQTRRIVNDFPGPRPSAISATLRVD